MGIASYCTSHECEQRIASLERQLAEAQQRNEKLSHMTEADSTSLMLEFNRYRKLFGPVPLQDSYGEKWLIDKLLAASAWCKERIAVEVAEARKLTWQRIDAEHLPRKGDEIYSKYGEVHATEATNRGDPAHDALRLTRTGWTHYRPINPPPQEDSRDKSNQQPQ
jgi:hypothetical protein